MPDAADRRLRAFHREDYERVRAWFSDPVLGAALGVLDDEWLAAVLGERPAAQFVFEEGGEVVAMLGVAWPRDRGQPTVVTDLAVQPQRRGEGLGREVIVRFVRDLLPTGCRCRTYVLRENKGAQAFFDRLGWRRAPLEDGMVPFDA